MLTLLYFLRGTTCEATDVPCASAWQPVRIYSGIGKGVDEWRCVQGRVYGGMCARQINVWRYAQGRIYGNMNAKADKSMVVSVLGRL